MKSVTIEKSMKVQVTVDLHELALLFADMTDDDQAQFFVEVAKIMETWGPQKHMQAYYIGRHLATCTCSSFEARELIENIHEAILVNNHLQNTEKSTL